MSLVAVGLSQRSTTVTSSRPQWVSAKLLLIRVLVATMAERVVLDAATLTRRVSRWRASPRGTGSAAWTVSQAVVEHRAVRAGLNSNRDSETRQL